MTQKLGTVFHETFSLSRPSLSQIINKISECPENIDLSSAKQREEYLRANTNLGTRYVKAMPQYALSTGLLCPETYRLSAFGKIVFRFDPLLERVATMWLMHYFICSPHSFGPGFWGELVNVQFSPGNEVDKGIIEASLSNFVARIEGKVLGDRSISSTATIFLGTYTKPDGLGALGIIEELETKRGSFAIVEPEPPSVWVFGIALLDYWKANYADRASIHLDELYSDRGLGQLFLIGPGRINAYLRDLQDEGYVEILRVAPPYRLILLRQDEGPLWQKLYASEPAE